MTSYFTLSERKKSKCSWGLGYISQCQGLGRKPPKDMAPCAEPAFFSLFQSKALHDLATYCIHIVSRPNCPNIGSPPCRRTAVNVGKPPVSWEWTGTILIVILSLSVVLVFLPWHLLLWLHFRAQLDETDLPFLPRARVQGYFWEKHLGHYFSSFFLWSSFRESLTEQALSPFSKIHGPDVFGIQHFFRDGVHNIHYTKLPAESEPAPHNQIHKYFWSEMLEIFTINGINKDCKYPQMSSGQTLPSNEFEC